MADFSIFSLFFDIAVLSNFSAGFAASVFDVLPLSFFRRALFFARSQNICDAKHCELLAVSNCSPIVFSPFLFKYGNFFFRVFALRPQR